MKQLVFIALCIALCNCTARKDVRYFQDISESDQIPIEANAVPVFQPNDILRIVITTDNNKGTAPFNLSTQSYMGSDEAVAVGSELNYLIDEEGYIEFPIFGKIEVAGKSKEEVKQNLKDKLAPYLINPLVHIEMLNFRISILGDVGSPGVFNVTNERINVLEAIALAGDLNISAKRENVLIIRKIGGASVFEELNLLDKSVFSSPYFYLKQNDVIYVRPNDIKTREASWESRIPLLTSISAFVLSIVILFVR